LATHSSDSFSSRSTVLPIIKGVAYIIIDESGKVLYSSPHCEKQYQVCEGDQIQRAANPEGRLRSVHLQDKITKKEIHLNLSTEFDLIWHGSQAKMLLIDPKKSQQNSPADLTVPSTKGLNLSAAAWISFKCRFDERMEMVVIDEQSALLTGFSSKELISKEKNYRKLISKVDYQTIYKLIRESVAAHQPYSVLYRIQTANGDFKWVEEHGKATSSEDGSVHLLEGWIVDVTEHKKIGDDLWERESHYRSLVEASPDTVLMLDKDGNIILGNKNFCDLVGVEDPAAVIGKSIFEFIQLEKALSKGIKFPSYWSTLQSRGTEFLLSGVGGTSIPMETNLSVLRGNKDEVTACIVVGRDVRERNQAQQALRESEARYRAIVENNPEMIIRFDKEGKVSYANKAILAFLGQSSSEIYAQKLLENPKTRENHLVKRLLEQVSPDMDPVENEISIHTSQNEERWYRWRTIAIKDIFGNFLEYQSMGEEITDKKKSQQAEKESENRLAQLMENIKLLSIILNLQGQLISCNSYLTELTGWKKEEILGQDWFSRFIPIDIAAHLKHVLVENANQSQIPIRFENPILTKDGEQRMISWTNTVMKDAHGNPFAIASMGEDITEKNVTSRIQEAILKISQATNDADDLDQLYRSIHEILKTLVPVENFFIALYDRQKNLISFPYFVDQFDSAPLAHPPGKGLTEYVLRKGMPVSVNPEEFDELVSLKEVSLVGAPSLDWIGIPLRVEKEIIGVMGAQTYSPGIRYGEKDEQILTFVSTQIAMVIDRKRREQALINSQKRNQLLIEASTDAIFMESLDGSIIDCNDVALQMYGYSREEMLKLNVTALVSPEITHKIKNYTQWELDQGGAIRDIVNVRKNGSTFPVEVSLRQTRVTESPVLVAYVRDISQQKDAARVIFENEEKFRTLSETTTAGIFIYRGDKYLYVNPMWCQITGFSAEELMAKKPLDLMNPEVNISAVSHIEQDLDGEIGRARVEHSITTSTGEIHTIDLSVTRIIFESQPAIIGTAIDITNRKQREHELEVIAEMSEALRANISRDQVLDTAMAKLMAILKLDGALFSLIDQTDQFIERKKASGVWKSLENLPMARDQGLSGFIISNGLPYINNHPESDPYLLHPELVKGFMALAGVPLIAKGKTIGALTVGSRQHFSENDLRLLKAIGDLTAGAIHRADLFDQTVQQTEELRHAYDSTLEGWALALELRDKETQGHSVRIAKMTLRLAKRLGIPESQMENIRRGALLHDIGKLAVPDSILLKNGALTPDEWTIIQKHPSYAYDMLSQIKFFKDAIDIPYCHHEWWDGSGYPRGLDGKNIPLPARIFCIVDVWDALTSNRPYRGAWQKKEALAHIINQAGTHFDPDIVNEFIQMIVTEKD
jgi:PAS domain S-box-containing protein/putative nucleotidyltransferase with HDIG domain